MDFSSLHDTIIESREDENKEYFEGKDVSRLNSIEDVLTYTTSTYYTRRAHDMCPVDKGYTVFIDAVYNRKIFIATKEVGLSRAFHGEYNIKSGVNVIRMSTNHSDYDDMSKSMKTWWIHNMRYVAMQLAETAGNVVIFCNNGRTRSPMYLAAYVIIMRSMSISNAMTTVGGLLFEQRHYILDRHRSFVPILCHIHSGDYNAN